MMMYQSAVSNGEDELTCFVLASPSSDFISRISCEHSLILDVVLSVRHEWNEVVLQLISVDTLKELEEEASRLGAKCANGNEC